MDKTFSGLNEEYCNHFGEFVKIYYSFAFLNKYFFT